MVANNALFAAIHQNDSSARMLPLGPLDELQSMAVRHRNILAKQLNVINWLIQEVVDVFLDRKY